MSYTYKLFEVGPDGAEHDTGKEVVINATEHIVVCVFELYQFTQYANYYRIAGTLGDEKIHIYYNYIDAGDKDTWILRKKS